MVIEDYDFQRSADYCSVKEHPNPIVKYVDSYTVKHHLLPVTGKDVLDVGCGGGYYCRLMKKFGAAKVVGIDMSEHMIRLAEEADRKEELKCHFQVQDAEADTSDPVGQFDCVISTYVLVYAENAEQLTKFCRFMYNNLKKGGRCVALVRNCHSTAFWGNDLVEYGYAFTLLESFKDGGFKCLTQISTSNENKFSSTNFCLRPETYETVFRRVGFSSFGFHQVLVDDECKREAFPKEYWDNYLKNPHQICIVADK